MDFMACLQQLTVRLPESIRRACYLSTLIHFELAAAGFRAQPKRSESERGGDQHGDGHGIDQGDPLVLKLSEKPWHQRAECGTRVITESRAIASHTRWKAFESVRG